MSETPSPFVAGCCDALARYLAMRAEGLTAPFAVEQSGLYAAVTGQPIPQVLDVFDANAAAAGEPREDPLFTEPFEEDARVGR